MRTTRGTWLTARIVILAALLIAPGSQWTRAQQTPPTDPNGQVASVEQLKLEAFKALHDGNVDRSNELIHTAASMSNDQSLAQMSEWIAQYRAQRQDFINQRHEQYDKVVADVQKLVDGGKEAFAIDKAGEAFTLTDNKDNFSKEPWVAKLIHDGTTMGADYEKSEQWIKARRVWADLAVIEPSNPQWKEKLNSANRRVRLLAMYVPDDFTASLDADTKDILEAEALIKPPTTQPTTGPTTKPLADNDNFKLDWHDTLSGIKVEMLEQALDQARNNYWRDVNYRTMLTGGLKGVQALITTAGLEKSFPLLADHDKRDAFAASLKSSFAAVDAIDKPADEQAAMRAVLEDLRTNNRQTVQLPEAVLINEFADGAFAELDQFSNMIWPSDVEEFNKQTQGEFGGVGIQIQSDDDGNLKVVTPVEDTPAYKLGITAGDIITRINGKSAKNISTTLAVKNITGPPGTEVTLTIRKADDGTEKDYTIKREIINVASVKGWKRPAGHTDWDYFIDPQQKIAYIRLTNFTKHSTKEMTAALSEIKAAGARGIIFDLRNDPGGLLVAATEISDKFLSDGTIVSTRADRENAAATATSIDATQRSDDCTLPMIVLVNQFSASASEIVAGALHDHHRATLIGERTFGKGSVQMLFPLTGRTAYLKLTTSHYYLPSGRCIHREENSTTWGVDPDVVIEMTPKQMRDANQARQDQEVIHRDAGEEAKAAHKDVMNSDAQLSTALLLMRLQLNGAAI